MKQRIKSLCTLLGFFTPIERQCFILGFLINTIMWLIIVLCHYGFEH